MGKLVKQLELEALGPTFSRPSPSAYAMLCYAKSLQSCPTLCDPIDGSPLGFPVPGILQARTLEWVAISFSLYDTANVIISFFLMAE